MTRPGRSGYAAPSWCSHHPSCQALHVHEEVGLITILCRYNRNLSQTLRDSVKARQEFLAFRSHGNHIDQDIKIKLQQNARSIPGVMFLTPLALYLTRWENCDRSSTVLHTAVLVHRSSGVATTTTLHAHNVIGECRTQGPQGRTVPLVRAPGPDYTPLTCALAVNRPSQAPLHEDHYCPQHPGCRSFGRLQR